jgi:hypothetical protein
MTDKSDDMTGLSPVLRGVEANGPTDCVFHDVAVTAAEALDVWNPFHRKTILIAGARHARLRAGDGPHGTRSGAADVADPPLGLEIAGGHTCRAALTASQCSARTSGSPPSASRCVRSTITWPPPRDVAS